MQDAQRKPNSVLFSLKELRKVERQRVQQEQDQQRLEQQQQRQAEQNARQQQEQEEQRLEQQRLQAEQQRMERKERQRREDQLRLEEAERRARVEAEMQLQLQRQRQEQAARAGKGRPMGWIPAALAVLVLGALSGYLGHELHSENARARAVSARREQVRDRSARQERTARQRQADLTKQATRYAKRITALEHALADARGAAAAPPKVLATPIKTRHGKRRGGKKNNTKTRFKLCLDSDDPLSCIGKGSR